MLTQQQHYQEPGEPTSRPLSVINQSQGVVLQAVGGGLGIVRQRT